ncbi:DUF7553 family protein [Halegenticoccus soli]|uniref:DUF7553 family protein n=1 Tax=Halegenticoccus soli TaxID=1985678 RepID=UPI000C6D5E4F|nr:hypothetical protein [Halegenticoccus soli]
MNTHFKDAWYYLRRAGEHVKMGLTEELRPVERRVRKLAGRERAPERGRLEKVKTELKGFEKQAEGEAKEAVATAKERIRTYRGGRKRKAA